MIIRYALERTIREGCRTERISAEEYHRLWPSVSGWLTTRLKLAISMLLSVHILQERLTIFTVQLIEIQLEMIMAFLPVRGTKTFPHVFYELPMAVWNRIDRRTYEVRIYEQTPFSCTGELFNQPVGY